MMICTVCQSENDEFAVTCKQCKAFLQDRIPNLNLFETAWGMIESPRASFRKIAIAEHKNFAVLLFALFGLGLSFAAFWFFELGDRFSTLLDLIIIGMISGPGIGILTGVCLAILYHFLAKGAGGKATIRTSIGVLAYSLTPIVVSVFLMLPIELLTFGMYMFTLNPHPYVLKPVSYIILMSLDSLVTLWTIILLTVGSKVVHQLSWLKAVVLVLVFVTAVSAAFILAVDRMPRIF